MGKVSATGGLKLFLGVSISTVIMAVGTVVLARLLSQDEYGMYSIALIPSLMINLFRDWGVNSAATRYIAQFRATNNEEDVRDIVVAGLVFETIAGLALSLVSVFLAIFIATTVFHRPESAPLISIVSVTTLSGAILTATQSIFVGYERMGLNSLTLICQAIAKIAISISLVLLGYGAFGAVIGYTFSFIVAGIVGIATVYFAVFKQLKRTKKNGSGMTKTLKMMLHYGVPFSISAVLSGFLVQFNNFAMVSNFTNLVIGNYQVTVNFSVILTFITLPISTVLFPAFAKLDPRNEKQLLGTVYASSVKYASVLLVPATMAMMVLSKPIVSTLFGDKWTYAPFFLTVYVISNLLIVLGSLSMNSLLAGLGETKMLMILNALTLILDIPLVLLLIPAFGILGMIVGALLAGLPSLFYGLFWAWRRYGVKADFKSSAKLLTASIIATLATYLLVNLLNVAEWAKLVAGLTAFFAVFILMAPALGAINQSDINNLRVMFSGLGLISKLLNIPLTIAEKIARITILLGARGSKK